MNFIKIMGFGRDKMSASFGLLIIIFYLFMVIRNIDTNNIIIIIIMTFNIYNIIIIRIFSYRYIYGRV